MIGDWELDSINNVEALTLTRGIPDASIDLIATDPPFNIDKAAWDSWATLDDYLAWLDEHLREFKRVLKPNGSLYLFASPRYAASVEMQVGKHFRVLNQIFWRKRDGLAAEMGAQANMTRTYIYQSERIIFAEQAISFGNLLRVARDSAGLSRADLSELVVGTRSGAVWNWEQEDNFIKPEHWERLRSIFPQLPSYEDADRCFNVDPSAPYTDVWDFATVNTYPGKHPCEKPLELCQHIIRVSSRKGALVLDPFCGSGNMLRAAFVEGRRYLGGDSDPHWARRAGDWIRQPFDVPLFEQVQP